MNSASGVANVGSAAAARRWRRGRGNLKLVRYADGFHFFLLFTRTATMVMRIPDQKPSVKSPKIVISSLSMTISKIVHGNCKSCKSHEGQENIEAVHSDRKNGGNEAKKPTEDNHHFLPNRHRPHGQFAA